MTTTLQAAYDAVNGVYDIDGVQYEILACCVGYLAHPTLAPKGGDPRSFVRVERGVTCYGGRFAGRTVDVMEVK